MKRALLMPMIRAAIESADAMTPPDRADVYDGIADVAAAFDSEMSANARQLSESIRESEMLQMHFRALLTQIDKPEGKN